MDEIIIFTSYNSFEADQIVSALQDAGIPAYIKESGAGQFLRAAYAINITFAIDIIVPAAAEEAAVKVLADMGLIDCTE